MPRNLFVFAALFVLLSAIFEAGAACTANPNANVAEATSTELSPTTATARSRIA